MHEIDWERDENTPNSYGTSVAKASDLLHELSQPRPTGDPVKAAIQRAVSRINREMSRPESFGYWRGYDLWYRKARRVESFEKTAIILAIKTKRRDDARREFRELHSRMLRLEAMLSESDPEFHRDDIQAIRHIHKI